MEPLKVDAEFQSKIPPLTEDEFRQLEQNILDDGEVHTPIVVWNGTIVDGHNRWKIIQNHPEIPYKIKEMNFADKWEAFDWMYKNQLGRRNLTDEQRTYMRGKLYEARKNTVGGQLGNDNATKRSAQNEHIDIRKRTAEQIAEELGIGKDTVKRAEHYAKGIDEIRKEEPELANSILIGKTSVPKKEVAAITKASQEEKKEIIKAIKDGTIKRKPKVITEKDRQDMKQIAKYVDDMQSSKTCEPTLDDLLKDLRNNSTPYIRLLNSMIKGYAKVIKGNHEKVIETIDECIVKEINNLKEMIINEYA